ncbi:hypothetical protein [Nonomuraea sediminis]|uniref:hypothetical protein n=1 Tax=Nonomuraea sediminis TaxID=2835864 RepID=UPI001BDD119E|nr:hypothetical protein [Nonomuraea sediminis]
MRRAYLTLGTAALLLGLTVSSAVADTADGEIHGCAGVAFGNLRVIDPAAGQKCLPRAERPIDWNAQGPAGVSTVYQGYETSGNPPSSNYVPEFQNILKPIAKLTVPAGSYVMTAYFALRNDYDNDVHEANCKLAANYPPGDPETDHYTIFNVLVPRQAYYSMQHAFTLTEPGTIVLSCRTSAPGWTARAVNIQMTATQVSAVVKQDIRTE